MEESAPAVSDVSADEEQPGIGRFLGFFLLSNVILISIHFYIGTRLVAGAHLPRPFGALAWAVLGALFVSIPARFALRLSARSAATKAFFWVSNIWFGAMGLFLSAAVFTDVARLIATLAQGAPSSPAGWVHWDRLQAGAMATLAGPAMVLGLIVARSIPSIERVLVKIPNLPKAFDGFRIAQISDVHIGETLDGRYLSRVVERVNSIGADAIAVTGDLIDGSVRQLREDVAPISELRAKDGVYFVTGNHEYYYGAPAWEAELRRLGLTVLHNEHRVLQRGDDTLVIAGTTDLQGGSFSADDACRPDLALAHAPRTTRVLLAHQPRAAMLAKDLGVSLQLSGHTHGGQIFPFMFFVRLQQPVVAGLKKIAGIPVYTSRGTGYWGPPLRVGARPEITELTLRAV